jgi:hypothetical protein
MFKFLNRLYGDAAKTAYYIFMQQNDYKERSLDMCEKWKKTFKRSHYFKLFKGDINLLDLEEDAHRFGISMTKSTLREFEDADKAISDQFMNVIAEASRDFILAMLEVLGRETDDSQGVQLPPEVVQKLLELYEYLKRKAKDHGYRKK